ncbi:hypothetical protein VQ643_05475 [Pseudomonas sp. F1_0610]|uniref:hypothetical protein n=1 Tax=Pseudomonas sp. F1_0610 TaxID=3114284 RepID=UPI0039C019B5
MNIEEHGFEIHSQFLTKDDIQIIITELETLAVDFPTQGIRNAEKKLNSAQQRVSPKHRHIVHIEYSSFELPLGLTWASS